MHSALIVFQAPKPDDHEAYRRWMNLWQSPELPKLTIEGIENIGADIWTIQLSKAMPAFCGLVALADKWKIPYRALFFAEPPDWIYSTGHPQSGTAVRA